MKYRKKPVVIDAVQWHRHGDDSRVELFQSHTYFDWRCEVCGRGREAHGWCPTLEGGHIVCPGDWIITGVLGECYPCKPAAFAATYEPVPMTATAGDWLKRADAMSSASTAGEGGKQA